MENDKNDRKIKILTILAIILLTALVSSLTFTMYTFTGTGSKENVITTSKANFIYEENSVIDLSGQYPMTDEEGIRQTGQGNVMQFRIAADLTLNYAVALDIIQQGETLTEEYIKVYLLKGDTVVNGFTEGKGRFISEIKPYKINGIINNYVMHVDSLTLGSTTSQQYTLKAWIADTYDLNAEAEVRDGNTISKPTTSETFKFKIKLIATDAALAITSPTP